MTELPNLHPEVLRGLMFTVGTSELVGELAAAMAQAQAEIHGAVKAASNPFYDSNYADLAAVWDACREPLSKNGLAVFQTTRPAADDTVCVVTRLIHSSGQWIAGELHMPVIAKKERPGPQEIGSCITYARRYALAAMVGVPQVDDDGNDAQGLRDKKQADDKKEPPPDDSQAIEAAWLDLVALVQDHDSSQTAEAIRDWGETRLMQSPGRVTVEGIGALKAAVEKKYAKQQAEQKPPSDMPEFSDRWAEKAFEKLCISANGGGYDGFPPGDAIRLAVQFLKENELDVNTKGGRDEISKRLAKGVEWDVYRMAVK